MNEPYYVRQFDDQGGIVAAFDAPSEADAITHAVGLMDFIPTDHYVGFAAARRRGAPVVLFYTDNDLGVRAATEWGVADGQGGWSADPRKTQTTLLSLWLGARLRP